jgi:branched-chain amino acid transport system ATP-binding protein
MLELENFGVCYDDYRAVRDLSLTLERGEALGITGRNGAGKTSTLKGILGLVETNGGLRYKGREMSNLEPHERAARGIGYLPQERRVFRQLTVEENLKLVVERGEESRVKEEVLEVFPGLEGRFGQNAGSLSGGEQVMVAIARVLISRPELALLDEPTEGLMPELEEKLGRVLEETLANNRSVVVTGQSLGFIENVASKVYWLENGRVKNVVKGR